MAKSKSVPPARAASPPTPGRARRHRPYDSARSAQPGRAFGAEDRRDRSVRRRRLGCRAEPMTGRERLNAILHRQPADRLAWTTVVDNATLDALPQGLRGMSGLDFYRHIGCDILLLDCWGMPYNFASPAFTWGAEVTEEVLVDGETATQRYVTPAGTLTRVTRRSHPIKYPVQTVADVDLYRQMWTQARFLPVEDPAPFPRAGEAETGFGADDTEIEKRVNAEIGDDGIVTRFWGPSAIPRLLELDMGTLNFYYLLHDHRQEVEALIAAIHEKELDAFRLLAQGPCDVVILAENTSTYYISPPVYRRYNKPALREFVEIVHAAGKVALLHMCGHVRGLMHDFRDLGIDGIHALTPPPTGDSPWEFALDVLGDDVIIVGVLDPTIFAAGPVEEIPHALDRLYTPRLRNANFILWPAADGIPVEVERFRAVGAWMEDNGARR